MNPLLQVVIPMAGLGSRFSDYGFHTNKYLLPIHVSMEPMIERAILSLGIDIPCSYVFVLREEQEPDVYLRKVLDTIAQKHHLTYQIASVSSLTEGPASTVYEARHLLQPDLPLLISNSDQVLEWDFPSFYKGCMGYDGCVLTYTPPYPLTLGATDKHSFLRLEDGKVVQCAEKIVLSKDALVGVHYFHKTRCFLDAYIYMLEKDLRAPNKEFYISLAYQAMLEQGKTVGYVDISQTKGTFYPVGEPDDYFTYLYKKGGYRTKLQPLTDDMILFENDKVRVSYEVSRDCRRIKNKGLLLLLEGYADMEDICLTENDITYGDICTHTLCRMIHIELLEESYKQHFTKEERLWNIAFFTRGWFMGHFSPSILDTTDFEIGLLSHKKGEVWPFHYHAEADEYNVLLKGKMLLNNHVLEPNTQFVLYKNEIACPFFLEDCQVLCIKSPSCPKDKHVV